MKILIDIAGADKGIELPIIAAVNMVDKIEGKIILVGKTDDIKLVLNKINKDDYISKFEILDCTEYITNYDEPAFAIKNKKTSNLVIAFEYMRENDNTIFVSASNTGALMAGGLLKLGRIRGIHRPALMTLLPTITGKDVIFLDSGANPEAKDISLVQYAKLGEIYAKNVLGILNPSIALLNIGAEEEKGTPTLKETYKLLKASFPNFTGNIEARYILTGKVDVIVCDGLMGNIAIKSLEGAASVIKNVISTEFKKGLLNKISGLIAKPVLTGALKRFDYKEHEGAVLIGINKPVIKVHGSSSIVTYEKAIVQAQKILKTNMIGKIEQELNKE
ncbi:MAG: phosphate acyltransferase PlsX [Clostridia bacterium]|nr:phosphate acyltransferase PlsX [Clostridia bacterium]MDD4386608.1 phosphate acyltransferase PlsX [Clostridia bacterium]